MPPCASRPAPAAESRVTDFMCGEFGWKPSLVKSIRTFANRVAEKSRASLPEVANVPSGTDKSRDLLFGGFALQTGLIEQAWLIEAFQVWTATNPGRSGLPGRPRRSG